MNSVGESPVQGGGFSSNRGKFLTRQIFVATKVASIRQNRPINGHNMLKLVLFNTDNSNQTPDGHKLLRYSRMKTFHLWPCLIFHLHSFSTRTPRNTSTYDRIHRQKRPRTRKFVLKMKTGLLRLRVVRMCERKGFRGWRDMYDRRPPLCGFSTDSNKENCLGFGKTLLISLIWCKNTFDWLTKVFDELFRFPDRCYRQRRGCPRYRAASWANRCRCRCWSF